ncbi:Hypothetical predicted protein [Mytilus galloprovincialis]|uniref:Uncharacterized protein n=1 Tax=Mytilus galloprovincialis TaxID=29158 RepID=A0A8B6HJ78_MYTGA|nr:Hypothetical predicted protein [Mytilus galloprovincialis]
MNKLERLQTESLMNIEEIVTTEKSYISKMDNNKNSYRVNIQKVIDTITEDGDTSTRALKLRQRTPAISKPSLFYELNRSISQDKKIERDWFYKLNVTCDNYSLHLINDFNIQKKFSTLSGIVQFKGHQKRTIECSIHEKSSTAFEKMYMHIVGSKHLLMSECIKQNFDLAARFLIARNIASAELCKHLNESMKQNRNHISKAIGWSITKQLYKVIQTKDHINKVIDVWPGYRCRCNRHCTKSHSRICSSEAVIILEVDLFSNTIQGDYYGIPIEQSFQVVDDEPTQV